MLGHHGQQAAPQQTGETAVDEESNRVKEMENLYHTEEIMSENTGTLPSRVKLESYSELFALVNSRFETCQEKSSLVPEYFNHCFGCRYQKKNAVDY